MEVLDTRTTELDVIISSSWRFHYPLNELLGFLPSSLRHLIRDVTPDVEPGPHQRFREILSYVDRIRGTQDWRALDDDTREFPKGCPQLIVCDGRTGIDHKSAEQLRLWLNSGLR